MNFIRNQGKPALSALLGNAFRMRQENNSLTFWFDPSKANLISMLEGNHHKGPLTQLAKKWAGSKMDILFQVAKDPTLEQAKSEEKAAYNFVQADPKVKLALELFKGEIIHLKELGKEKGEYND